MSAHLFEEGDGVLVVSRVLVPNAPRGVFTVLRQLPPIGGENMYRLRNELEPYERAVGENQLTPGRRGDAPEA